MATTGTAHGRLPTKARVAPQASLLSTLTSLCDRDRTSKDPACECYRALGLRLTSCHHDASMQGPGRRVASRLILALGIARLCASALLSMYWGPYLMTMLLPLLLKVLLFGACDYSLEDLSSHVPLYGLRAADAQAIA